MNVSIKECCKHSVSDPHMRSVCSVLNHPLQLLACVTRVWACKSFFKCCCLKQQWKCVTFCTFSTIIILLVFGLFLFWISSADCADVHIYLSEFVFFKF